MAPGEDDPEPDSGRILSPEELSIEDDEHVEVIDDGRYVVSPDVRTDPVTTGSTDPDVPTVTDDHASGASAGREAFSDAAVHDWLREDLGDTNARYGFDVTARFDGRVGQHRLVSNDIITAFESLLLWYARQVDGDTPVEEVLGILLSESNVTVRYPPAMVRSVLDETDLSADDSIADLLAVVEADDGVQL